MQKRFVVLLLAIAALLTLSGELTRDRTGDSGLQLERPPFITLAAEAQAQEKGVNFLQQEAGISAYVNVGRTIDLTQVRGTFKSAETPSDGEYLIGEVALRDLPEDVHPHVYVNKDGWIVAYYSKHEPASKIMHWIGYRGGKITTTTLEDAIRKIYDALQLPYPTDIQYYHFQYSKADKMMLITKINDWEGRTDTFYLTIPQGLRLEEASWSLYHYGHCCVNNAGSLGIDGKQLARAIAGEQRQPWSVVSGNLTIHVRVGIRHRIDVWNEANLTGAAIVLIYQVTGGQK